MYRNSSDKRVQRSGGLLFDALVKLLEVKPFSDIGIKEISEKANIGRATFYRNFDYVEDVIKLKVDQLFEELNELNTESKINGRASGDMLKTFFAFWVNHPAVLQVLLKADCWTIFTNSLNEIYKSNLAEMTFHSPLTTMQVIYVQGTLGAQVSALLQTWVKHGQNESAADLFELFELPYLLALKNNFIRQ